MAAGKSSGGDVAWRWFNLSGWGGLMLWQSQHWKTILGGRVSMPNGNINRLAHDKGALDFSYTLFY